MAVEGGVETIRVNWAQERNDCLCPVLVSRLSESFIDREPLPTSDSINKKKWGPWDPKNDVLYCMRALRLVICAGESDNETETAPEPQADLIPAQWRDSLITRSGAGAREANPCGVQDGKVT
jgi:hypothetical protein